MIKHILKLMWNKKGSNALIMLEIFLAFLILFFVLSYVIYNLNLLSKPLGFETKDRWRVYLDSYRGQDSTKTADMKTLLRKELLELDRVEGVSFSRSVSPYGQSTSQTSSDELGFEIETHLARVDEYYASTMGANMISGRWFHEDDVTSKYNEMVANKAFMDKYFEGDYETILDSVLTFRGDSKLVGVVEHFRYTGEFSDEAPIIFNIEPFTSTKSSLIYLKMAPDTPASYEEVVNKRVADITKTNSFVIHDFDKLRRADSRETWIPLIVMLSICGFLCINIALGLFGVLWYNISKRKGEIGLRRAIGAHSTDISKQFITEIVILAGIAIGFGMFFAIQIPLLKLGPLAPVYMYSSIVVSAAIIILLVILCALNPSIQAARIHPATALHEN